MNIYKLTTPLCAALGLATAPALALPILGADLATFAVLGAEAGVTNVPTSTIGGNLGATNPSIGGGYVFSAGSLQGNTSLAANAQLQLDAAILSLNGMANTGGTLGADLTGIHAPGVYDVLAGPTNLSGSLVLNGGGSDSAVWVFRFASTLITDSTSTVTVSNVGDGSNVGIYWVVGSAATLNGATFAGNVLAHDLISSDGNLALGCGRLLSAETQVTLIMDSISQGCADFVVAGGGGSAVYASNGFDQGFDDTNPNTVPEPSTLLLLGAGLLAGVARAHNQAKSAA